MKKMIIRAMFATLAIAAAAGTFGFINNSSVAKAEMRLSYPDGTGGVWNYQVYDYLNAHDHPSSTIYNIDSYGNRYSTCPSKPSMYTITYVNRGSIIGVEDVQQTN